MKNSIKRAQSRAGSSFAERENQRSLAGGESNFRPKVKQLRRKLMMTLVLLLTLATGAWADEQKVVLKVDPITVAKGTEAEIEVKMDYTAEKTLVGLSFSLYLPDGILLKGFDTKEAQDAARASALKRAFDIFYEEGIWGEDGTSAWLAVKPQVDGGLQITLIDQDDKTPFVKTHAPVISVYVHAVADVSNVNGTIHGITLTDNENNSVEQGNIADVLIPFNATAQEPESTVALTRGTGDKINEWTLTNGMPAGNVTVTAEYFPQATAAEGALTAATGVAATTSEPLVTLDASKLTGATKLMYLASTDATKPGYDAQGWSDKVPTADSFTEGGNVNVWYYPVGTDDEDPAKTFSDGDICATPLTVSLDAAPTYSVSFAKDTPEPDKWAAEPNTGVKKGQTVTVTYSGQRKVIGVKAEKKAAPKLLEFAPGGVKFYYYEGETWGEAIRNHPENAANGWSIDEDDSYVMNNGTVLHENDNDDEIKSDMPVDPNIGYIW